MSTVLVVVSCRDHCVGGVFLHGPLCWWGSPAGTALLVGVVLQCPLCLWGSPAGTTVLVGVVMQGPLPYWLPLTLPLTPTGLQAQGHACFPLNL